MEIYGQNILKWVEDLYHNLTIRNALSAFYTVIFFISIIVILSIAIVLFLLKWIIAIVIFLLKWMFDAYGVYFTDQDESFLQAIFVHLFSLAIGILILLAL